MKFRFCFTFQIRKWISLSMKDRRWEGWEECGHCKVKHSPWFLCSCHHSISIFISKVWAWFLLWLSTTKNVELITKNRQIIIIVGLQTIHFRLRNYSRTWQRNQDNSLVSTILLQEDLLRWKLTEKSQTTPPHLQGGLSKGALMFWPNLVWIILTRDIDKGWKKI